MNAVTAIKKPGLLSRPLNIALVVGAIIVLWIVMRNSLSTLIILALFALLVIGIKKPLWALAALLLSQLTLTDYMVSTPFVVISLRLLLSLITLVIIGRALIRRQLDLGPGARRIFTPMLLLTGISVVANLYNIGFDLAFKDFRNMLVGLMFALFLAAIIQNNRQLKLLGIVLCIIISASAVIGVMQHYNILGMANATLWPGFLTGAGVIDQRVPGMGETELELAYILSATPIIILCIYLAKGTKHNRKISITAMFLMIVALYFTYTRSALFAVVLGIMSLLLFVRTRIKWELILVFLFVVIFVVVQTNILGSTFFSGRSESSQLESTVGRTILWQAGVGAALDNPILGIGADQFISVSPRYASSVDPYLIHWEEDRYWSWRTLGTLQPHNDFLNIWVSYGTGALIMYLWLHFAIVRNCFLAFRSSKDKIIRGLALGLAGALITYVANSFYHNISNTMPLLWILAGFSIVAVKLARKSNETPVVATSKNSTSN
jgi:O-antigen ligase